MSRRVGAIALGIASLSSCPISLGLSIHSGSDTDDETTRCGTPVVTFAEFVQKHKRGYVSGSEEYAMREALFDQRSKMVEEHNCAPKGPWKAGMTYLADWTDAELQSLRGHRQSWGGEPSAGYSAELNIDDKWPHFRFGRKEQNALSRFPSSFSWSNLTSMKEEKNQGQCGSCWAFAADAVLRAHAEIAGRQHKFSVSQIVACAPNPQQCGGHGGCKGSTAELAFEYVMHAGAVTADEFPYPEGGGQDACPERLQTPQTGTTTPYKLMADGSEVHAWHSSDPRSRGNNVGMTGWTKLAENREDAVVRALVEVGPVAVAVAAGFDWNLYWSGIMNHKGCEKGHVINHAVVLFGYGSVDDAFHKQQYWLIKNSWGHHWGEKGNVRLERTTEEEKTCGWDRKPEMGSGCIGGPKEVYVCGSCGVLYDTVVPHFSPADSVPDARSAGLENFNKRQGPFGRRHRK